MNSLRSFVETGPEVSMIEIYEQGMIDHLVYSHGYLGSDTTEVLKAGRKLFVSDMEKYQCFAEQLYAQMMGWA